MEEFNIYFNGNRQFITVHLWDVNPGTFANWGGGYWGYFLAKWENPKIGFFGEVHLVKSRIREDLVAHEMPHVIWEWFIANNLQFIRRNEEKFCRMNDELVRKFYNKYRKILKEK